MIQNVRISRKYVDQTKIVLEKRNEERIENGEKPKTLTDEILEAYKLVNNGRDYETVVNEKIIIEEENTALKKRKQDTKVDGW